MNEDKAPADYRYLIRPLLTGTGDGASLANVNTAPLPDGATCYVIADAALWVLDKTSVSEAIANTILVPGSGPGRWYRQASSAGRSPPANVYSTGTNAFAVDGNWQTSSGNNFALDNQVAPDQWSFTALGGIATLLGKRRPYMVIARATLEVGDATAPREVFLTVSHNNDLAAAASAINGASSIDLATAAIGQSVGAARLIDLNTGDTVRVKAAGPAGASSLAATSVQMSLIPC